MPRLRRLSGNETIRALERLGFVQVRQRGSHVVHRKETTQGAVGVWCPCIESSQSEHCAAS